MADQRTDQLTEDTAPVLTDLVYVEHDPGGTPANRKVQLRNLGLVIPLTSTARAALLTPWDGMTVVETDTSRTMQYDAADTTWHRIDGKSNRQEMTTGTATTSAAVELTIATVSVAAQNYPYRLELSGIVVATAFSVAADIFELRIKNGGTTLRATRSQTVAGTSNTPFSIPNASLAVVAGGATTITMTLIRIAGTGTITIDAALPGACVAQIIPT